MLTMSLFSKMWVKPYTSDLQISFGQRPITRVREAAHCDTLDREWCRYTKLDRRPNEAAAAADRQPDGMAGQQHASLY